MVGLQSWLQSSGKLMGHACIQGLWKRKIIFKCKWAKIYHKGLLAEYSHTNYSKFGRVDAKKGFIQWYWIKVAIQNTRDIFFFKF